MTLEYCGGNSLMAEAVFGWGRQTVARGLGERRTGDHLPGRASGLQWPQTLGRAASARGASPASARRSPCATRPDIPHLLGLHQTDSPSGLGGAPRSGVWGGAIALAQYHGGGCQSYWASTAKKR